jgi:hypothetical protein
MTTKIYLLINLSLVLFFTSGFSQDSRIWATYYGADGNDGGFSVATDVSGNVYMAGITQSYTGIAYNGFQNSFGGGIVDAYLVKFDSSGNRLWATYYGGTGNEMAFFGGKMGVATDRFGNVFLAGFTNSTTGIASGGFQNSLGGSAVNAYLVKFDSTGNRIWGTYYGGINADKAYSVAIDNEGNVYMAGIAGSAGLAFGGFQNTSGGLSDALLVKFDTNGNRLWATYYGGPGTEEGFCVTTDNELNVYLAGITTSTTSIASGGFQNTYGGGAYDLFLVKFESTGERVWATYYGGAGAEMELFAGDIDVETDAVGSVFLTGLTSSTSGIASGGFQNTYGGGANDAFLVKFRDIGSRIWSTYYGGIGSDKGYSVATDSLGNVYMAGRTDSPDAIASAGFQNTYSGALDAFLVKFNPEGIRECGTYFGGSDMDECNSIALDDANNIYLGGNTANISGIAWNGFQNFHGGGTSDANLIKFTSCPVITHVEEISASAEILIYPNPSSGKFRMSEEYNGTVAIFDILGRSVYILNDFNGKEEIDISELQSGTYFLKIHTGNSFKTKIILIR